MGGGFWSPASYTSYSSTVKATPRSALFKSKSLDDYLDPSTFDVRESRDSADHPKSTPIIIASDVTGSMGSLAEQLIKNDLGTIMKEIYDRKPVTDPHILMGAVGDTYWDSAPFQATQFEADMKVVDQIEKFFIEGGGGGNSGESYIAAWYFAAYKTATDSFAKRGKKGYVFTIGDEAPLLTITKDQIKTVFNDVVESDMTAEGLLDVVRQQWNVFHVIVKPHGRFTHEPQRWKDLLGQNVIVIDDISKLGEVIVSTIQIIEGEDLDAVANSWSGSTAVTVRNAVKDLAKFNADGDLISI